MTTDTTPTLQQLEEQAREVQARIDAAREEQARIEQVAREAERAERQRAQRKMTLDAFATVLAELAQVEAYAPACRKALIEEATSVRLPQGTIVNIEATRKVDRYGTPLSPLLLAVVVTPASRFSGDRGARYAQLNNDRFNTARLLARVNDLELVQQRRAERTAQLDASRTTATQLAAGLQAKYDVSDSVICGAYYSTEHKSEVIAPAGKVYFLKRVLLTEAEAAVMLNAYTTVTRERAKGGV